MSDKSQDGKILDHNNNAKGDGASATEIEEADEEPQQQMDKASAQNAADLEKVTDVSEEKEFSRGGNASALLSNVASEQAKTASAGPVVVTLRRVDIDALVENFDIKRLYAERLLKRNHGDMKKAVRELMYSGNAAASFVSQMKPNPLTS
ncbi:hypothetical protein BV898_01071 [Hypsibius exemplaris]|uniref:Nascent polypeptide-associated complex subunit alpha-like UBA domain-containing protein n=1 Tax=Hypsibius exemplaris TaxID=2072580 RepID=A0A1W0XDE4_HYPEX|nr:hypothetical protein BV898_01071 [Hypsibius exemplaris]